jgi:hypothetical protein
VEKALVCFPTSSLATINGIVIGVTPNSTELPPLNSAVAARYIAPVFPGLHELSAEDVYDLVRMGGSIRLINVVRTCHKWTCRVEWWYEGEAQKFEFDFKLAGSMVKDWKW